MQNKWPIQHHNQKMNPGALQPQNPYGACPSQSTVVNDNISNHDDICHNKNNNYYYCNL